MGGRHQDRTHQSGINIAARSDIYFRLNEDCVIGLGTLQDGGAARIERSGTAGWRVAIPHRTRVELGGKLDQHCFESQC